MVVVSLEYIHWQGICLIWILWALNLSYASTQKCQVFIETLGHGWGLLSEGDIRFHQALSYLALLLSCFMPLFDLWLTQCR